MKPIQIMIMLLKLVFIHIRKKQEEEVKRKEDLIRGAIKSSGPVSALSTSSHKK